MDKALSDTVPNPTALGEVGASQASSPRAPTTAYHSPTVIQAAANNTEKAANAAANRSYAITNVANAGKEPSERMVPSWPKRTYGPNV
ncbi:hypothetical protein HK104_005613, partial [Borealophlyctis nickersoniae]